MDTKHKHAWKKSERIHKRKGFFFVSCECGAELQATKTHGYLHVFDTNPAKNRADDERATVFVSARITKSLKKRLKESEYSIRELLTYGLDFVESSVLQ